MRQLILQAIFLGVFTIGVSETEIEMEIAELEAKIATVTEALLEVNSEFSRISEGEKRIEELKVELAKGEANLAVSEKLLNIYRSAFRFVSPVEVGTELGDLALKDGSIINNAVLVSPHVDGLSVTSPSGPKTVRLDNLPDELKSRFAFPTPPENPGISFAQLKQMKPEAAKSREEIELELAALSESEATNSENSVTPTSSAPLKVADQDDNSATTLAEKTRRNSARQKHITALRERYSAASDQRKKVLQERTAKETEFRKASIKTARATMEREIEPFNSKIAQLDAEMDEIRDAISRIQSEWE